MNLADRLVDDIHCMWRWLTTWLNLAGTSILAWALAHEGVVATLIPIMPPAWRPYAPVMAIVWGLLIQLARSWKQQPKIDGKG